MLDFTYENKTEILFGKNKVDLLGKTVKKYNFKNVLVVYGGGSALKSGLIDRVTSQLKEEHIGYSLVGGVCENPTSDFVYEAIDFVKKNNIDLVLAVGGGSVIDASKAIGAGAVYDGDFWDFFRSKDRLVIERTLPVAVVLTMAAAGSENSESIVITNKELQEKRGNIKTSVVRPIFTIEDPLLTLTLPKYNTACGIVDMMVHIMERYFSNTENDTNFFINIARQKNIFYTAGSDFHICHEKYRSHGLIGDVYLNESEICDFIKKSNLSYV